MCLADCNKAIELNPQMAKVSKSILNNKTKIIKGILSKSLSAQRITERARSNGGIARSTIDRIFGKGINLAILRRS